MLALVWPHNPGSAAQLVFFAIGALSMVLSAIVARSYTALCLTAFLWLGLWLKFIVHLFYLPALIEPIGEFDGSVGQYDLVMLASGIAFCATALAFLMAPMLRLSTITLGLGAANLSNRFVWSQFWTYLALLGLCIGIALLNIKLGIFQVGIAPLTILPKPGNALISLFLTTGYFFVLSYFILCDRVKGNSLVVGVITLIFCAALMSSSLLSRGVVVFHLMAVLLALAGIAWQQRTGRALLLLVGALILSGAAVFATVRNVEDGREVGYAPKSEVIARLPIAGLSSAPNSTPSAGVVNNSDAVGGTNKATARTTFRTAVEAAIKLHAEEKSGTGKVISELALRRWLGVEGAMVAAGNKSNSPALLASMLSERSAIGQTSQYQHLAGSPYVLLNGKQFQFATLPGPVGTFLFGGSVIYVFFGMLVLCLLAMAMEKLSQVLGQNVFVTCFVAVFAANSVAQFGLTPLSQLPQIGYMLVLLLGFWGARLIAPHVAGTPLRHLVPALPRRAEGG
ncbi:hypothetical protein [Devosia sp.]|uniref:hypothetical protein n=1 Tax=Devosia sp. TaxID=1871048 RepID=UPI002FCC36DB